MRYEYVGFLFVDKLRMLAASSSFKVSSPRTHIEEGLVVSCWSYTFHRFFILSEQLSILESLWCSLVEISNTYDMRKRQQIITKNTCDSINFEHNSLFRLSKEVAEIVLFKQG